MAQGSRQIQSQAQQQVQTLSPQQILVVKLLELPAVELEDRIHAELLENPALEEGREESAADEYSDVEGSEDGMDNASTDYDSLNDYLTEDDIPDYKLQENNRSQDDQPENIPFSESTSFYEILKEQLGERNLTEHQNELVEYLIGSLDDDGLLRKSLESICDELVIYAGVESPRKNWKKYCASCRTLILQESVPVLSRNACCYRSAGRRMMNGPPTLYWNSKNVLSETIMKNSPASIGRKSSGNWMSTKIRSMKLSAKSPS